MAYRTGLQIDNQTSMAMISGRIEYSTEDFDENAIPSLFTDYKIAKEGSSVTVFGAMNIQPGAWVDNFIDIYYDSGYDPIRIQLDFSNGHWMRFEDVQRRAYDYVSNSHPLPVPVDQPGGRGITDRMSAVYWTRHDVDRYSDGLVTYAIRDHSLTAQWMAKLDQQRRISEITVPGTHDSGTWTVSGNAQCQTHDIRQQLDAGIRFIDIRLELLVPPPLIPGPGFQPPASGHYHDLQIYHGLMSTGLYFQRDVVSACRSFLAQNPSETVLMLISRNRLPLEAEAEKTLGMSAASAAEFADHVEHLLDDPIFLKAGTIPTVEEAKGHVVLITRYPGGPGIPLQVGWPDDSQGPVTEAGNKFYIQDVYGFGFDIKKPIGRKEKREKLDKKWSFIETNLTRARRSGWSGGVWWINYSSATGALVLDPVDFAHGTAGAPGMNARLIDHLKEHPQGYYGTVPMDFPHPGLIQRLIATN